eukprot:s481_g13.t1
MLIKTAEVALSHMALIRLSVALFWVSTPHASCHLDPDALRTVNTPNDLDGGPADCLDACDENFQTCVDDAVDQAGKEQCFKDRHGCYMRCWTAQSFGILCGILLGLLIGR